MNQNIQNRLKRRLLELREELEGEIVQLSDSILTGAHPVGEHDGCVSESIEKEIMLEHTEEDICQAVSDALTRLDDGTFGRCLACGKKIAARRLEALPYTAFCIGCEYQKENERIQKAKTQAIVANALVGRCKRWPASKASRAKRNYLVGRMRCLPV
jgi:RNA polymerase-binding transcription factor DksA